MHGCIICNPESWHLNEGFCGRHVYLNESDLTDLFGRRKGRPDLSGLNGPAPEQKKSGGIGSWLFNKGQDHANSLLKKKCPTCGASNNKTSKFCQNCDQPLQIDAYDYLDKDVEGDVNAAPPKDAKKSSSGGYIPWDPNSGRAERRSGAGATKKQPPENGPRSMFGDLEPQKDQGDEDFFVEMPMLVRQMQNAIKALENNEIEQAFYSLDYAYNAIKDQVAKTQGKRGPEGGNLNTQKTGSGPASRTGSAPASTPAPAAQKKTV